MRHGPYPEYRDSGVEWLGAIPAHWKIPPLRARYVVDLGKMLDSKRISGTCLLPYLRNVDVQWDRVNVRDLPEMDIAPSEYRRYTLAAGDLLVCEGGEVGRTAIWGGEVAVCGFQKALHRLRARRANGEVPRFLYYVMSASAAQGVFVAGSNPNTIPHLTAEMLRTCRFAFPPPSEQNAIAAFLDHHTTRINALIEKKERLIELLQEKRAALITRAVTKGLDPTVSMKDSGVEWLGEIPAHWEVRRLKQCVPALTVGIVVTPSKYYVDEGVPCLRSLNISSGTVTGDDMVFISAQANELHRKSKIYAGDIVVVRTGRAGTAAIVPAEYEGTNCIDLLIVRRSERLVPSYLYFLFNSGSSAAQVAAQSVGAIQEHYNTSTLGDLLVPLLRLSEQDQIARFLEKETKRIDCLVAKAAEGIDCLKEYRTALISAAVTGRIDVRDGALPVQGVG